MTTLRRKGTIATGVLIAFGAGFGAGALVGFAPAEPEQLALIGPAPLVPGVQVLDGSAPPLELAAQPSPRAGWSSLPARPGSPPPAALAAAEPTAEPAAALPEPPRPSEARPALIPDIEPAAGPATATKPPAEPPEEGQQKQTLVVERGDTLMDVLRRARVDSEQAYAAIDSLSAAFNPKRLQAGQDIDITIAEGAAAERQLVSLAVNLSFDHQLQVTKDAGGAFATRQVDRPQQTRTVRRAGRIDDSLYLSAERQDVPPNVVGDLIKLFSWDVDFQRDIQPGDGFETVVAETTLEGDQAAVRGELLFARLDLSGEPHEAYRFTTADGTTSYYDRAGRSLRKFLLRTPVDGARLSSTFGMRRHPILGYSRMHKGIDFAAPTGTPIYAAGSGRIEYAGRKGSFGNYIRIRHPGEYGTAYAHLSRIAKGVRPGRKVDQGAVIGYIGTTGRSTGPHLHYEVLKGDTQINPLKVKQGPAMMLAKAEQARFKAAVAKIDRLRQELGRTPTLVSKAD